MFSSPIRQELPEKMTVDEDILACFEFRDSLNEHCFSKTTFLQWISSDEFLLVFDSYFVVYRLLPFDKTTMQVDRLPVSLLRFEINSQSSPPVLQHCLDLLKYPELNSNFARAGTEITNWNEINEVLADAVFVQPPAASLPGAAAEAESLITISGVYSEQSEEIFGHLFIITLLDGRMFWMQKTGHNQAETISMTSVLHNYISEAVFGSVISGFSGSSVPVEEATSLAGLKRIRELGWFLSTKFWIKTELRLTENPDSDGDGCGLSLQRSDHLVIWRYSKSKQRNFQIVDVVDNFVNKSVSAVHVLPVDEKKCVLLLGTRQGEVLAFTITTAGIANGFDENAFSNIIPDEINLPVSTLRLFYLGNDRHLLVLTRRWMITAIILSSSSSGSVKMVAMETFRAKFRFDVTDIVRSGNEFYFVSSDKVATYEICLDGGVGFNSLAESALPLENSKVVGLAFSKNGILRLDAIKYRMLDRYSNRKPLQMRITKTLGPNQLWLSITSKTNLEGTTDCLILLRSFILNTEKSKVIGDLLLHELESLESDEDDRVLLKLKVIRFATIIFSAKRSKEEDLEFWNRVKEKVERILVVKLARSLLQRARCLDWTRPMPLVGQAVASVADFLSAEGMPVTDLHQFGELARPRCPLCNVESFQTSTVSEHVCANEHRYPACSLTFLPISSFNYRKCNLCDLPTLGQETIKGLSNIIPEPDRCQFCDGRITSLQ